MADGTPSMTALLGLLAVAGFQNRDKIAELLGGKLSGSAGSPDQQPHTGLGGLFGSLGGAFGNNAGGFLNGGLGQLLEHFTRNGHGDTAASWVTQGANKPIAPPQLEQAIGPDVLDHLSRQTGLSKDELLSRLSRELPDAVDKYTPEGRLPA